MLGIHIYKNLRFLLNLSREIIDMPARVLPIVRANNHRKEKRRLLITRLDGIGDFILFLDTFKEYRKLYSPEEWEITLLGNRLWRDLAENLSYADRYWFMEVKRFKLNPVYRYRLIRQVRNAKFDLVIQQNYSRGYWLGDIIVKAGGAPKRIGSEGDPNSNTYRQKQRSDKWYTNLIPAEPKNMMELERNAEFIRGLGLTDFQANLPKLPIPNDVQQRVDAMLERVGIRESSKFTDFYILFPGAGSPKRQWPVERFADLAQRIYDQNGWIGIVCGGPSEEMLAEQLRTLSNKTPLLNLSGKTNLIELAGVIRRAKVLIGNETSAVHIASAVGTPSICILGGGHFGRFVPYSVPNNIQAVYKRMSCFGCNWKCIHSVEKGKPVPCIEQIGVHRVMENIRHQLYSRT